LRNPGGAHEASVLGSPCRPLPGLRGSCHSIGNDAERRCVSGAGENASGRDRVGIVSSAFDAGRAPRLQSDGLDHCAQYPAWLDRFRLGRRDRLGGKRQTANGAPHAARAAERSCHRALEQVAFSSKVLAVCSQPSAVSRQLSAQACHLFVARAGGYPPTHTLYGSSLFSLGYGEAVSPKSSHHWT